MDGLSDEQYAAEKDAGYRAIGRYIVAFSPLVRYMRVLTARHLTEGTMHHPSRVEMLLGDARSKNVADSFFGLCRADGDLDLEQLVTARFQTRVMEANEVRTDVAHGDWTIGDLAGFDATEVLPPAVLRIRPGRRSDPGARSIELKVELMNEMSDDLWTLTMLVIDFGKLALQLPLMLYERHKDSQRLATSLGERGQFRVRDVYANEGTTQQPRIARSGPHANDVALMKWAGMDGRWDNSRRHSLILG